MRWSRDYGSLSYSRWKASSKILSDPGSRDFTRQLSQVPTNDPAPDVSFVAPLPKRHLFRALSYAPPFADFTNGGCVSGGHCPIPSPLTRSVCAIWFEGMCELLHTGGQ